MNILLYSVRLDTGGIASVSVFLANAWKKAGHNVAVAYFSIISDDVKVKFDDTIPIYSIGEYKYNKRSVGKLKEILKEFRPDVVINQFGLPWQPVKILLEAGNGLNFKIISCYHSAPNANGRLTAIDNLLEKNPGLINKTALKIERKVFSYVTSRSMRYVYNHSDAYVLLSPTFFPKFLIYTRLNNPNKLYAIANPVTLDSIPDCIDKNTKEKILLYVGRIENVVKRVDRVIEIWRQLEPQYPDWSLKLVGDGEGLDEVKNLTVKYNLKRVSFEGYKSPTPYYEKASIILLTSDFEGFGLVLVEGMTYGVVPVAYGSYDSVFDIIKDSYNGFVVLPEKGCFPVDTMASTIESLMMNSQTLEGMSLKANQISKKFSHATILSKWDDLFMRLNVLR